MEADRDPPLQGAAAGAQSVHHLAWLRTRLTLDDAYMERIRHGGALIAVGFGGFAFLAKIVSALGAEGPEIEAPSRIFSLVATAVGLAMVATAMRQNRKLVAFVDADTFGEVAAPELPGLQWSDYWAWVAIVLGAISFVALLFVK